MKRILFLLLAIPTIMLYSCNEDDKKKDDDSSGATGRLIVNVKVKSQSSGKITPVYKRISSGEYYVMDEVEGTPGNGNIYYLTCKFMLFTANGCEYDIENMRTQALGTIMSKGLKDKNGNFHPNLFANGLNEGMYRFNSLLSPGKYCIVTILEKDNALVGASNRTTGSAYSATIVEIKENEEVTLEKIFPELSSSTGRYDAWENNAQ
ncbi:MAG: hypothetical protein IJ338_07250 [Bacteroidaceae bacterium]|nr:hypothetical protein [Bacteroidaceae bacterium]